MIQEPHSDGGPPVRLTTIEWAICTIACIGFAFDTYELTVLPVVVRPAIISLAGLQPGTSEFNHWVGLLFFVPLFAGGCFAFAGGYLTDRFGRVRLLTYSVVIYGMSALASGFVHSLPLLLLTRSITVCGACVEFVAAIAWLAEVFPYPRREAVLGFTQAFSALGGFMVAGVYYLAVTYGDHLPVVGEGHDAWRYTLVFGAVPALPLMFIRPFLPESPVWRKKKELGTLKRARVRELFQPVLRKTTLITTLLVACSFGAAFGAQQHILQIVPLLPQVEHLLPQQQEQKVSIMKFFMVTGDLMGRFALAYLAIRVMRRRLILTTLQAVGLIIFPLLFLLSLRLSFELLSFGTLLITAVMVAQFSFWGNYLPRVYPTHLRGTGDSFATSIGGRVIGTSAALLTTELENLIPGSAAVKLAYAAACVSFLVYLTGFIASFWLPDLSGTELPD